MRIRVWKSPMFFQASRQKNKKKEGRTWLAGAFYKNFPFFYKIHAKTSLFYKIYAKTSLFYKKSKKTRKKLPSFTKKLPSFTKNLKKPKNQKTKKPGKNQIRQKKENRHSIWYLIVVVLVKNFTSSYFFEMILAVEYR
jgi:hypothetical protein